jgi:hypothetical protein
VVGDIRTQTRGRPPVVTTPIVQGRRASWAASAIVGLLFGVAVAAYGWSYLEGDADVTIAKSAPTQEPAPQPAAALVAEPSLASVVPIAHETPKASASARPESRELRRDEPKAPQSPLYVGTLSIDADPGGDVFVDRTNAGHTPLRLTNLRAGSHLIWVERDGYHRWTRVVPVPADRITRLSAELEPIASR